MQPPARLDLRGKTIRILLVAAIRLARFEVIIEQRSFVSLRRHLHRLDPAHHLRRDCSERLQNILHQRPPMQREAVVFHEQMKNCELRGTRDPIFLRVAVDTAAPSSAGAEDHIDIFFNNSPVFRLAPNAASRGIRPVMWFDSGL